MRRRPRRPRKPAKSSHAFLFPTSQLVRFRFPRRSPLFLFRLGRPKRAPAPRDVLAPPPPLFRLAWRALPLGMLILFATLAMLAGTLLTRPGPRPPRRLLTIGVVPVGSGEAAWVRTPSGRFILIGGGPPETGGRVVRSLKAAGARKIALLVQPYAYAETIGGLPAVLEAFPSPGGSWDTGYPPPRRENRAGVWRLVPAAPINAWQQAVGDLLTRQNVPVQAVRAGQTFNLGDGVRITVFAPASPFLEATPGAPNNSIVLRLTYGDTAFLFAGGLERAGETALLARASSEGMDLSADWLRVARCGTREATSPEFLRQVSPVFAVVSAGGGSAAGYPHRETLTTLANNGALVRRTDDPAQKGADLVFESDGTRVTEAAARP